MLENFKVFVFQVELEKGNDKVIFKVCCVWIIWVSFDLIGVLDELQGLCIFYLIINDDKGMLIVVVNLVKVKIIVNNQEMDIIVVKVKDVDIVENQCLFFVYDLEDKFDVGFYWVFIFMEIGMLGFFSIWLC